MGCWGLFSGPWPAFPKPLKSSRRRESWTRSGSISSPLCCSCLPAWTRSPATLFSPVTRILERGWRVPSRDDSRRSAIPEIPSDVFASATFQAISTPARSRSSRSPCSNGTTAPLARSFATRPAPRRTTSRSRCVRARISGVTWLPCPIPVWQRRSTAMESTFSSICPGIAALFGFERAGIAADRLAIFPRMALPEYHRLFNTVDLALDAIPYSGGTTTCDTLWMGVPVVTLPVTRSVSRSAASILATLGLGDWIAASPEDYVRLAVKQAGVRAVVAELRRTLRERMRRSPLMDELRFARDVEDAYRRMWRTWCGSEAK